MSKPTTRDLLIARKQELVEAKAKLDAAAKPLHSHRAKLRQIMEPLEADMHQVNTKIAELEHPHKGNLELQIAAIDKALSDKVMMAMEATPDEVTA